MSYSTKVAGTWRSVDSVYAKESGVWRKVRPKFRVAGNWSHDFMVCADGGSIYITSLKVNGVTQPFDETLLNLGLLKFGRIEVAHGDSVEVTFSGNTTTIGYYNTTGVFAQANNGDVDGDGVVTYFDAYLALMQEVSLPIPYGYSLTIMRADIDSSGTITGTDTTSMGNKAASNYGSTLTAGTNVYTFTVNSDTRIHYA